MLIAANIYIPLSLLFLAISVICILQIFIIIRLKKECAFSKLITSASIGSYYSWHKRGNTEELSPALISMLRLKAGSNNFETVAELFGDNKADFIRKFEDLKNGTAENFSFIGLANIQDNQRELQCIGCSIIDQNNYKITGVVLWFFDVSQYVTQIKTLSTHNAQLTKELKEYSGIFNTLPIPIWKRDSDFKIRFCNFIYSNFVDGESDNISSAEIPELDQSLHSLSRIARDNSRALRMKKHLVVQGERRFYSITEMSIKNSDEILGFAYDITDQDEIEKELARHISAHADLLESSSSAMAVYGPDTKLKFYNNAFVNLWGLKITWLDTNPTYGEILEVLREKRKLPEQVDFKKFRKEQMMLFQDITKPHEDLVHLPDGKAIRIIAIPHALGGLLFAYEDITDRLAMERSFNTLIEVQRETLDNLSEGVALFGESGKIRLYNPVYTKMWSESEEYLEKNPRLTDLMERAKSFYNYGNKWEKFKATMISEILGRKPSIRREELKNGRVIDILSRPLPNGDTLVSFVDITDSIIAEQNLLERNEALIEADKLKTEFLANISYELRTPLTSIIGFAEALQAKLYGELNIKQMDYINGIYTSSSELLSLINDILDLASMEAGYLVLDKKDFDVYKALNGIVKLLVERCRTEKKSLSLVCDKKIGNITADETRIKHVIFKLLSNSMKFTKEGGNITLGAENIGKGKIKIWVEDNGAGIDDEDKQKVFERFFKTKSTKIVQKSGAGLGLAVVKNIVQLHNGSVTLESEPGKGTIITIILTKKDSASKKKLGVSSS